MRKLCGDYSEARHSYRHYTFKMVLYSKKGDVQLQTPLKKKIGKIGTFQQFGNAVLK